MRKLGVPIRNDAAAMGSARGPRVVFAGPPKTSSALTPFTERYEPEWADEVFGEPPKTAGRRPEFPESEAMIRPRTLMAMVGLILLFHSTGNSQPAGNELMVSQTRPVETAPGSMCLHTKGNKVLDAAGQPVRLCGVNIASLEWKNDGDHVEESVDRAISDWKVNLIRLPLAQDRWFGKMTNQTDGGAAYRVLVDKLVDACAAAHVYIDLDLHWSDCGTWANEGGKLGQHNMPDIHSVDFWQDLATRYRNQPNVIFGLYNEPHDVSFAVWRDGGTATDKPAHWNPEQAVVIYEAVGLQKLYDTVRASGATNLVTVSGLDWGYDLSGVLQGYGIKGANLIYETHPYPNKPDWDRSFGDASWKYPVYVGEWGFGGRSTTNLNYANNLMKYVQTHKLHWTAWDLHTAAGPTLIKNWRYEPTVFGEFVKEQLAVAATARNSNN